MRVPARGVARESAGRTGALRRFLDPVTPPAPSTAPASAPFTTAELLRLAVPTALFAVLTNGYRSVDQFWSQDVSTAAQAAIGSSTFVTIVFYACFHLVAGGASPLIARTTGAGDAEARRSVTGSAVVGALAVAAVLGVVGSLGAPLIASSLGLEGAAHTECVRYLTALSLTLLPLVFTPLVDGALVAMGEARVPLLLHGLSLALNALLTPLLLHHAGLGVVGAALASNLSRLVTTGLGFIVVARRVGLRWTDLWPAAELVRIVRVGAPVAAGTGMYAGVYVAMLKTSVSPLGAHVNAALGIGFSALEGFTWASFYGTSMAVGSFVGRALGAQDEARAWAAIRKAIPVVSLMGLGAAALFYFGGDYLTGLFTKDPLVHRAATEYAQILAYSQLFVAYETLFFTSLRGAGDTRTAFWAAMPFNLVRIPLAWWLALPLGLGAAGIWWTVNLTTYAKVAVGAWLVHRGGWAKREI